ncbi:MAG: non-hydrolyzing UDP-N-acetylglucosamine 2-epimerase [Candidatus Helarchaeota archaeon]
MQDKILLVAGARPNFIKLAPIIKELEKVNIFYHLVHTGQHYDYNMSKIFFKDLNIPNPDYYLNVGSGSNAYQTACIMIKFEKVLLKINPKLVIVVGDVNSTLACSLVAKKLLFDVAHIEAGLRSFDRTMPEEINRVLTDQISDLLFVSEKSGIINLKNEGIKENNIFFVGNIMIDTLIANLNKAKKNNYYKELKLTKNNYALMTIHRPSNVDNKKKLIKIIKIIETINNKIKIVFPMHPRTQKNLKIFNLSTTLKNLNVKIISPVGYLNFLNLMMNAKFILSDSGGIQEEASFLRIPILTLRENTERPITIEKGTNTLVGTNIEKISKNIELIFSNNYKRGTRIEKWDGKTTHRIIKIIKKKYF